MKRLTPSSAPGTERLADISTRLEAATSRLEDIASIVDGPSSLPNGTGQAIPAAAGASTVPEAPKPVPQEPLPRSIEDFDNLIEEDVTAFVTASGKIGGLVEEQVCGLTRMLNRADHIRQKQYSRHSMLNEHTSLSQPKQKSQRHNRLNS